MGASFVLPVADVALNLEDGAFCPGVFKHIFTVVFGLGAFVAFDELIVVALDFAHFDVATAAVGDKEVELILAHDAV